MKEDKDKKIVVWIMMCIAVFLPIIVGIVTLVLWSFSFLDDSFRRVGIDLIILGFFFLGMGLLFRGAIESANIEENNRCEIRCRTLREQIREIVREEMERRK